MALHSSADTRGERSAAPSRLRPCGDAQRLRAVLAACEAPAALSQSRHNLPL
jgi:hypothetical protein